MSETIFDRILRREIPADIVFEDDDLIAFRDIAPKAPVHILIVPKKRLPTLNSVESSDEELLGKVVTCASKLALSEGISESGYRLVMNCNADGGQSVFQIHCHLLGGRPMEWPPG